MGRSLNYFRAAAVVTVVAASCSSDSDRPPAHEPAEIGAADPARTIAIHASTTSVPLDAVSRISYFVDSVSVVTAADPAPRTIARSRWIALDALSNGRRISFGECEGPATRVIVDLSCAEITFSDGTSIEREFPGDGPSRLDLTVRGDGNSDILVMFDVDRALHRVPIGPVTNPDAVLVHPSAMALSSDRAVTIGGRVHDDNGTPDNPRDDRPIAGALVTLTRGELPVAQSLTEADGSYAFVGAYRGEFDVVCFPDFRAPGARAVQADASSSSRGQDFLFQLAEADDDGGW